MKSSVIKTFYDKVNEKTKKKLKSSKSTFYLPSATFEKEVLGSKNKRYKINLLTCEESLTEVKEESARINEPTGQKKSYQERVGQAWLFEDPNELANLNDTGDEIVFQTPRPE
jgi:hypothetical protein